jgi:pimeloyl-ACP methyl ester carboxylesterase
MTTYEFPGFRCRDHLLAVPLDHNKPDAEKIEVFAREVTRPDKDGDDLPWLVFLQGGPGHRSDRPAPSHGWLPEALEDFRVLLLDPRGTGRSAPVNRQTLPARGTPAEQAEFLTHFRADSIVADAEAFRRHLLGERKSWSILGQSFGGFCALTYLSRSPEHLREVMISGGLPSTTVTADEVYRAAYPRVRAKNQAFFSRYVDDSAMVRRIAEVLRDQEVLLPGGDRLTVERFQTVGLELGMAGRFDAVHFLLEEAFVPRTNQTVLSDVFLGQVEALTSFAGQPLFAVMHEPIYGQGAPTDWAAQRVRAQFPEFAPDPDAGPVLLTGEMIYPWQFEQDSALVALREAAELLAQHDAWPDLYDQERLAGNEVPVVAAVYHDDMYVDREMSLETASRVRGGRAWVTNAYEHDGLRYGAFTRLLGMARGRV